MKKSFNHTELLPLSDNAIRVINTYNKLRRNYIYITLMDIILFLIVCLGFIHVKDMEGLFSFIVFLYIACICLIIFLLNNKQIKKDILDMCGNPPYKAYANFFKYF